jgi:hypothetical protein
MRPTALAPVLLAGILAAGCLLTNPRSAFEPATRGPSADEVFVMRSYLKLGREPGLDERRRFQESLDERVRRYLRDHPEVEQSTRYTEVRFYKQVGQGTPRKEVLVLLEEPDETTVDPARMAQLSERFWPTVSERAREAWLYPGWVLFFDEQACFGFIKVLNPPPSMSFPNRP